MRVLDLFSGIGGFSLGLERAGMRTVAFCEIDPFCRRVLAKHWPGVPCYDDVRSIPTIGCDVIAGGFPCQPWSHAGNQLGAADDRHLWPSMLEVVKRERPAWVLGENVVGLHNLGLDGVLSDLEAARYAWRTFDIPAGAVGANHKRHRLWIVARDRDRDRDRDREPAMPVDAETPRMPVDLADAGRSRLPQREAITGRPGGAHGGRAGIHAAYPGDDLGEPAGWLPEPAVGRVANGVPRRVDRLRSLGNAVVPQVVEVIGRAIMRAAVSAGEQR